MSRVAHIVVDMQSVFLEEGACSEVPNAREIVANVNAISCAVRGAGGLNVFLRYTYDPQETTPWTSWYSALLGQPFSADLAAATTPGNPHHELWTEIDVAPGEPVINKTRFSGFTPGTCALDDMLKKRGIDTVIVTGTLTNCCSEATARDAHQLNYKVIFVSDGNATITDEEHNATLGNLYVVYADVVSTDQVLDLIASSSPGRCAAA
jgi:ureidoacrylate peracid hydrolase